MHPIYRSDGEVVAVVHRGYLYNIDGEWIGQLRGAEVFGASGEYMGYLSQDRRLLRKRNPTKRPHVPPPTPWPSSLKSIPERFPLATLFKQLPFSVIDVFEEFPERFRYISELRPDLD